MRRSSKGASYEAKRGAASGCRSPQYHSSTSAKQLNMSPLPTQALCQHIFKTGGRHDLQAQYQQASALDFRCFTHLRWVPDLMAQAHVLQVAFWANRTGCELPGDKLLRKHDSIPPKTPALCAALLPGHLGGRHPHHAQHGSPGYSTLLSHGGSVQPLQSNPQRWRGSLACGSCW